MSTAESVPSVVVPRQIHHAANAMVRTMPLSATSETKGQMTALALTTESWACWTLRLWASKRLSSSGSTV